MIREIIDDVFNRIIKINMSENRDAIPHSDSFFKQYISSSGVTEDVLEQIITILRESHKILVFSILREDKTRNIKPIYGYVDADPTTIRRLKNFFHSMLTEMYEEEYGRGLMAHQIIQELFPKINIISNTPLGSVVNKSVMLDEYERLLEKNYNEYTEDWKEKKLQELLDERGESINGQINSKDKKPSLQAEAVKKKKDEIPGKRRAVDSENIDDYNEEKSKMPVEKLLSIYGIDFFFRVHLRRYEFDFIKKVVESGTIQRRAELKKLKEMIQKVKNNASIDTGLAEHLTELYRLDMVVSQKMHTASK